MGKVPFFRNPDAVWLRSVVLDQKGVAVLPWKDGFHIPAPFGGRFDLGTIYFGRIDFVGKDSYHHGDEDGFLYAFGKTGECGKDDGEE